jgi:hypothetical protein
MILLQRTRDATQLRGYTGASLQSKLGNLLQWHFDEGASLSFKPKARQRWRDAKEQLKTESFGKCAYCEAATSAVAHGDVEHFRPKSTYWWLAYCYDNYAYSCQVCNQTFKGDRFPKLGRKLKPPSLPAVAPADPAVRAALAARLQPDPALSSDAAVRGLFGTEDADLPHPYLDDPERLYAWKENRGAEEVWLVARGTSTRAKRALKAAEEVLGLNRPELLRLRWLAFDELEVLALALQSGGLDVATEKKVLAKLLARAEPRRQFAAMTRHFLKRWGLQA